jgi:hypothetical protein
MSFGHVLFGVFLLILAFLTLNNWGAANGLIGTTAGAANTYTRTLQGR